MLKERHYLQRGQEHTVLEVSGLFAVHHPRGAQAAPPVGLEAVDAQEVAHLAGGLDPSDVAAFQQAGWQFVRPRDRSATPDDLAKVFVKPGGRLVLGLNRLTVKLADAPPEAAAEGLLAEHG